MENYLGCFCLFLVSLNHLPLLRNRIPRCVNFVHTLRDCCYAGASNFEFQNFLVLMEYIAGVGGVQEKTGGVLILVLMEYIAGRNTRV